MTAQKYQHYLEVDQFLQCAIGAKALLTALQMGLIDHLINTERESERALSQQLHLHPDGLRVLLSVLKSNGVLVSKSNTWSFTETFRQVLCYLDLIRCKLEMAMEVSDDYFQNLDVFAKSPQEFQQQSKLFQIFDYSKLLKVTPANCAHAARWMRYTTVLTKYETLALIDHVSLERFENAIDLGGNSGEFARQLIHAFPKLSFTVADLPVVCEVGHRHVSSFPDTKNVRFQTWDLRAEPVASGFDLISCKSLLHDWPLEGARELLLKIRHAVKPGGMLMIFERAKWNPDDYPWSFGELPIRLFHYSYRHPDIYRTWLEEDGWSHINVQMIDLDVPFMLIQAER
ncbi:MAG: hypothetical protein CMM07_14710 [Rhodopirellula sp.]|nr:hypothetical protein [Rhodopirellula sp.]